MNASNKSWDASGGGEAAKSKGQSAKRMNSRRRELRRWVRHPRTPMKCFFPIIVAVVSFFSPAAAQAQSIYGSYQDCPFHCRTIRINPDHTFEYRLNGDLYNDERHKGTWNFVDRKTIRATSFPPRSPLKVVERPGKYRSKLLIKVIDPNGAAVHGAIISGIANGKRFVVTTNDNGTAEIPICRAFVVSYADYRGSHRVRNASAREFEIGLTVDQIATWVINQTWLIEANRLYIAADDGTFDRTYWLAKLSPKRKRGMSQSTAAPNNSLDARGGNVFRN
jgi:hypothetical protein